MLESRGGNGSASTAGPSLREDLANICLQSHPLLEDVLCQRLQGHPGPHGAEVETSSAEIYLEWSDRSPEVA